MVMGAVFVNADFTGSIMTRASIEGADLSRADLTGVIMRDARISRTRLQGANFTGANLSGADLSTVIGLSTRQLDDACGDEATALPPGVTIRACKTRRTR
jgi:uncharacterized protein YjbI with pentapeptide repeats